MSTRDDVKAALQTVGISTLGITAPMLADDWTGSGATGVTTSGMGLVLASGSWRAPLPVLVTRVSGFSGVTLLDGTGAAIRGPGMLLTVLPGAWLRLSRLYAQIFESADSARPLRATGRSVRPVPRYFFVAGTLASTDVSGQLNAGDRLDQDGTLTVHDAQGLPIDPLAVAAAFSRLMTTHALLRTAGTGTPAIQAIAELGGATATTVVRLSDLAGAPASTDHLTGITAVDATNGMHSITGAVAVEAASGSFTADERKLLVLGPATTGRLAASWTPPALPSGVTLVRDFFSLRVLRLGPTLLGEAPSSWRSLALQTTPPVRVNEAISLLRDGNDVIAAAEGALSTTGLVESLAVAQQIDGAFDAPDSIGDPARWPAFPAAPTGAVPGTSVPAEPRPTLTAVLFDDGVTTTAPIDVVATVAGVPAYAAVRLFTRIFKSDGTEARGDGAGGVADASASVNILLRDPLGLRTPTSSEAGLSIPTGATLHVDASIVTRDGHARIFGNLTATIGTTSTTTVPGTPGTNAFGTASRRGVCRAGMLDLGTARTLPSGASAADLALALLGEGTPRDASRFPTMARRELLAAGRTPGGTWQGVLSAGRMAGDSRSAAPQRGSPGGAGGREVQLTGLATGSGRLAYDIARAAFRRTTNVVSRAVALRDDNWDEPTEPTAPAEGSPATGAQGTFAGAILQTIAPLCETPEFGALGSLLSSVPGTFADLVDWLKDEIPSSVPLRSQIESQLDSLANDDDNVRAYGELTRELASANHGRRDSMWALNAAIGRARRFIYIETPGFGPTGGSKVTGYEITDVNQGSKKFTIAGDHVDEFPVGSSLTVRASTGNNGGYTVASVALVALDTEITVNETVPSATVDGHIDESRLAHTIELLDVIRDRLAAMTGLHVTICTSRNPPMGKGYEPLAARELLERRVGILGQRGATTADDRPGLESLSVGRDESRVVAFHPVGFPGRDVALDGTVVIVDDCWMLIGSTTFRRRGLTFDGGTDAVLVDTEVVDGVSPTIRDFRQRLVAERLGVPEVATGGLGFLPDPTFTRLEDGVEVLHVVRERLRAGGLGRIKHVHRGNPDNLSPDPGLGVAFSAASPEGNAVATDTGTLATLLAVLALAGATTAP